MTQHRVNFLRYWDVTDTGSHKQYTFGNMILAVSKPMERGTVLKYSTTI